MKDMIFGSTAKQRKPSLRFTRVWLVVFLFCTQSVSARQDSNDRPAVPLGSLEFERCTTESPDPRIRYAPPYVVEYAMAVGIDLDQVLATVFGVIPPEMSEPSQGAMPFPYITSLRCKRYTLIRSAEIIIHEILKAKVGSSTEMIFVLYNRFPPSTALPGVYRSGSFGWNVAVLSGDSYALWDNVDLKTVSEHDYWGFGDVLNEIIFTNLAIEGSYLVVTVLGQQTGTGSLPREGLVLTFIRDFAKLKLLRVEEFIND